MRYFLDSDKHFWMGPIQADDNLHYARLEGKDWDGKSNWVLRRSDPDELWTEIGKEELKYLK